MSTLALIVVAGVAMSVLALSGSVTLLLPPAQFDRIVPVLVALAAGTLIGGAVLHLLPEAVGAMGSGLDAYLWLLAGFVSFLLLEQFLHWHHCHRPVGRHGPLGLLILVADGVHNLVGGLAVGSAFLVDAGLGVVTWTVAAVHEIPQELGDFGIPVHAGWTKPRALAFNVVSASTFLLGGVIVYFVADTVSVAWLLPFAAGNFLYIGAVDLVPEVTGPIRAGRKLLLTVTFTVGLGLLLAVAGLR